ncbi:MAG: hypothetical protein AB7G23_03040 [Vicinamibacterales bacterium]
MRIRPALVLLALLGGLAPAAAQDPRTTSDTAFNTLTAADDVVLLGPLNGRGSAKWQIQSGLTGTVTFECSVTLNGSVFAPILAVNAESGAAATTADDPDGLYTIDASGCRYIQVRVSAYTSGSAVVDGQVSSAGGGAGGGGGGGPAENVAVTASALPTGAATAANQSTLNGHVDGLEAGIGAQADAAAAVDGNGSLIAINKTILSRLDAAADAIDTVVENTGTIADGLAIEGAEGDTAKTTGPLVQGLCVTSPASLTSGQQGRLVIDCTTHALVVEIDGTVTESPTTSLRITDLDETEDQVSATATTFCGVWLSNPSGASIFVHVYNATAANVTVGSTTPVLSLEFGGNADDTVTGVLEVPGGCRTMDTALTLAATTTLGGSTGPTGDGVLANVFTK